MARGIDALFEFDAPQTFTDLSAPLSPQPAGQHDAWFDQVHVQHSRPSAELARALAAKLQDRDKKEQLKDARPRWSVDKENQQPTDWREIVAVRNKQLKRKKSRFPSLKEVRATQEPFQTKQEVQGEAGKAPAALERRRKPLADVGNRLAKRGESEDLKDLQELLKRHNKKFKATHTYEPPQHSVREVKQWEREVKKSYYALSAEERVLANQEIAVWKQRRQVERNH